MKKFLKVFAVSFTAIVLVTALTLYLALDLIPNYKYNKSHYDAAISAIADGDYITAYENLVLIPDFKDAAAKLDEIKPNYYQAFVDTAKVGSYVYLGQYEQDNDLENGKEIIQWRVLAVEGSKILVISEYVLDARPFELEPHAQTCWENSDMREWLNGEFLRETFTEMEQNAIAITTVTDEINEKYPDNYIGNATEDKIFFLSISEVKKYFSEGDDPQTRYNEVMQAWPTEYAEAQGVRQDSDFSYDTHYTPKFFYSCYWLLRTMGYDNKCVLSINYYGQASKAGVDASVDDGGIRPAMWIDTSLVDFVG